MGRSRVMLGLSGALLGATAVESGGQALDPNRVPKYDMQVTIADSVITIVADVTVPAARLGQDTLVFSLAEAMSDVRAEVISPALGAVTLTSRLRRSQRSGWGTYTWTARPRSPIPANSAITLRIRATSIPGHTAEIFSIMPGSAFGAGIKTAWYPEIEDGPEYTNGEPHGLRGTGRIRFTSQRGSRAFAPGVVVASSDTTTTVGFPRPVYFTFAAGPYHGVTEPGPVPVSVYRLRDAPTAKDYARGTAQVLAVLVQEFGRFPQPSFAVIEVPPRRAEVSGFAGASLEGVMFANSDFLDRKFNIAYYGHEISHQWWPNSIRGNRQPPKGYIMSEGLAQYGSLRAVEVLEGAAAASTYRRRGYPGFPEATSIEKWWLTAAAGYDDKVGDLTAEPVIARALVLSKGSFVWDMLSREVGRTRFREAMGSFTEANAGRSVGWSEFLDALAKNAGQSLQWFYDQWFGRTGAPTLVMKWSWRGGVAEIVVSQDTPTFRVRVPVAAYLGSHREMRMIDVNSEARTIAWRMASRPDSVVLDPEWEVLRLTPEERAMAVSLAPYTRIQLLQYRGEDERARAELTVLLDTLPRADPTGLRFMLRTIVAELMAGRERWAEAREAVRAALAEPAHKADLLAPLYLLDARAAKALGDVDGMRGALDRAIAADRATGGLAAAAEEAALILKGQ